jgi:hypothetical protein
MLFHCLFRGRYPLHATIFSLFLIYIEHVYEIFMHLCARNLYIIYNLFNWKNVSQLFARTLTIPQMEYGKIKIYGVYISIFIPVAPTWSIGHPRKASFHFSFLIFRQSVGLLVWGISPLEGRYLTQTQNKRRQTYALSGIRTYEPSVRAGEDSS